MQEPESQASGFACLVASARLMGSPPMPDCSPVSSGRKASPRGSMRSVQQRSPWS